MPVQIDTYNEPQNEDDLGDLIWGRLIRDGIKTPSGPVATDEILDWVKSMRDKYEDSNLQGAMDDMFSRVKDERAKYDAEQMVRERLGEEDFEIVREELYGTYADVIDTMSHQLYFKDKEDVKEFLEKDIALLLNELKEHKEHTEYERGEEEELQNVVRHMEETREDIHGYEADIDPEYYEKLKADPGRLPPTERVEIPSGKMEDVINERRMAEIISTFIKAANRLDSLREYELASDLDKIIEKMAK